jgi:amino acid transporter
MKKKAITSDSVYAIISLISLIYINYYQNALYYKPTAKHSILFDKIYEYIATPCFYFFITAFITAILLNIVNINMSKTLLKVLTYVVGLASILYIVFIIVSSIKVINLSPIGFNHIYSVIFIILGCLFALASHKN